MAEKTGIAMKRGAQHLSKNPNWKGGRTVASNGYILLKRPDHHAADVRGYVYEHRLVAEAKLGRRLLPGEQVHHVNDLKTDNRPANIEVAASRAHHAVEHRSQRNRHRLKLPGETNPRIACACGCGHSLYKYDSQGRPRQFISGHNAVRNARGQFGARRG